MKESYIEGPASHDGPESCAGLRKESGEALTGEAAGGVLSREKYSSRVPTPLPMAEGNTPTGQKGEPGGGPARSKTSSMRGRSMRENREIPHLPPEDGSGGRAGKAEGRKPAMHGGGKSDSPVVPANPSNKAGRPAAERGEGRGLTKENASERNTPRTQSRIEGVPNGLERVRQAAIRDRRARFSALFHHVSIERLREAFFCIKRDASAGVDGVSWEQYEGNLEENLQDLHSRLHRGAYRPKPSRRAYIPKPDGRKRPLGIAALEDKVVQRAAAEVLSAIYEVDFLGFSYGFRPGREAHQALDALAVGIQAKKISWILDADIRSYFDTLSHEWTIKFLEHRIADKRILRLIHKWLKAGVVEEGAWRASEEGSPQGASISPLLANIYLHYVLDLWTQQWRRRQARGDVIIARYADDFVVGFQHQDDAQRFKEELAARFAKFSLELHPEKTRLIRFGRFAVRDSRRFDGKRKPETFDFLGFTHYCTVNRNGTFQIRRITKRKRLTAKLHEVKEQLRRRMHLSIPMQGRWLGSVVRGYFQYHAIPGNGRALNCFHRQVTRLWYRSLNRRSERGGILGSRMRRLTERWLPPVRIIHPWPEKRFAAMHPR
jgi:RNA-directed DNA polymerase